ncbi:MAG: glutamyl-tRNA amidotransferase [Candidatus Tectimicrobiota bacterium]
MVELAVNGTLMRGLALNQNLLQAGATFVREALTAPFYRLWSIDDRYPAMQRVATGGAAIALEIWAVPAAALVTILQQEPPGLGIGTLLLADGAQVLGVLGEAYLCAGKPDITAWGGWRAYMASADHGVPQ